MAVAKKAGDALVKGLGADGLNLIQNNGLAAGQTVFHFHMHLIPRYEGKDEVIGWTPGTLTDGDKEEILAKAKI